MGPKERFFVAEVIDLPRVRSAPAVAITTGTMVAQARDSAGTMVEAGAMVEDGVMVEAGTMVDAETPQRFIPASRGSVF